MAVPKMILNMETARLTERDLALVGACEAATHDSHITEIEEEFEGIGHDIAEPWN